MLDGEPNIKCKEKYFGFFQPYTLISLKEIGSGISRKLFEARHSHKFTVSDWQLCKIPLFDLSIFPIRFGFKINNGSAIQFTIEISDHAL